ncbi:MAG: hypothetical protein ACREFP_10770 [Acetobacteraceae bacterium]
MTGLATFGVLAYYQQVRHILPADLTPVTYAAATGTAALPALGSGRLYDRIVLRGLILALPLTAAVPVLAFRLESLKFATLPAQSSPSPPHLSSVSPSSSSAPSTATERHPLPTKPLVPFRRSTSGLTGPSNEGQ